LNLLDLNPKPVNTPETLLGEDQCRCESTGTFTANSFRYFWYLAIRSMVKRINNHAFKAPFLALLRQSFRLATI